MNSTYVMLTDCCYDSDPGHISVVLMILCKTRLQFSTKICPNLYHFGHFFTPKPTKKNDMLHCFGPYIQAWNERKASR